MSRIPVLTAKKIIRLLQGKGFRKDRQKGSHLTLFNPETGKSVTVPVHTGVDIGKGLMKKILTDAGLDPKNI